MSIAGAAIAIYTTANGPWGYTDPVVYISTARSLDRGQGLVYYEADAAFRPITIEPPFYSITLGAIGLLRVNLVAAARWLNIFAFCCFDFHRRLDILPLQPRPGAGNCGQRIDVRLPLYGVDVRLGLFRTAVRAVVFGGRMGPAGLSAKGKTGPAACSVRC